MRTLYRPLGYTVCHCLRTQQGPRAFRMLLRRAVVGFGLGAGVFALFGPSSPLRGRAVHAASAASTSNSPFVNSATARRLDERLMSKEGGYVIENLMELAGLSVASAVDDFGRGEKLRVLLLCGPGNNGGDGLVAARHLKQFGHETTIAYPKPSKGQLFENLVLTAVNAGVKIIESPDEAVNLIPQKGTVAAFDLVVDGIFGFSFTGAPRAPFDAMISKMATSSKPVFSIDIPSGWPVDDPLISSTNAPYGFHPAAVISLTAPKLCMTHYSGAHYLGLHRVLPPALADELGVAVLPPPRSSQGSEQFVKLSIDGQGKLVCNAQEAPQGVMSVTLVTAPSLDVAKKISSHLVEGGLAACVNILPGGVTSVYRWEGVTNTDDEVLMIIKSSSSPPNLEALRAAVLASHPYKVPEIIHLPVSGGLQQYVDWVGENSRGEGGAK